MPIIPNQKSLFNLPEEATYLNCAYMAPQLKSVTNAGVEAVQRKENPAAIFAPDFFTASEEVRSMYAGLIAATADDIAFIPSVSYGIAVAANNIPAAAGCRILVLEEQFPSNVYAWRQLAAEKQLSITTINRPEDDNWTDGILQAITSETAVVALPHCHWTDGSKIDLVAVRHACDKVSAALVIDATQSLGAMPFSVKDIRPDFMIVAAYKWLLGPYSFGFLYADSHYHQGKPLEYGWISRENSEDFAGLVNYRDTFQSGTRRYDVGERSNFVLMPMALAALRQISEWGVGNIAATLGLLTDQIAEEARKIGLRCTAEQYATNHLTAIKFDHEVPAKILHALKEAGISVSVRGKNIRLSPHLYNDSSDIERLFAVIAANL